MGFVGVDANEAADVVEGIKEEVRVDLMLESEELRLCVTPGLLGELLPDGEVRI